MFLLLVLAAGCSQRHDDEENLAIFKYNESAGILTLDPIYAKDLPHIWACNQVFNSLVAFDDKMNLVPMVAKSWDVSEDGLVYTFHLRNDVQFHEDECFNGKEQVLELVAKQHRGRCDHNGHETGEQRVFDERGTLAETGHRLLHFLFPFFCFW